MNWQEWFLLAVLVVGLFVMLTVPLSRIASWVFLLFLLVGTLALTLEMVTRT